MLLTSGIDLVTLSVVIFLLPCAAIYLILTIGCTYLLRQIFSRWVFLESLSLGLRLGYILSQPWIGEYPNSRAARAHGTVLTSHVEENRFKSEKSLLHESRMATLVGDLLILKCGRVTIAALGETFENQEKGTIPWLLGLVLAMDEPASRKFHDGRNISETSLSQDLSVFVNDKAVSYDLKRCSHQ